MQRRVLPLDGGAKSGVNTVGAAMTISSGRGAGGGAAASARSLARKGTKSARKSSDSPKPVESVGKRPKRRSSKPKKKQVAAIAVVAGVSALVLILSLFVTLPPSFRWISGSPTSDAAVSSEIERIDRFMDWFQAAGGHAESINIAEFPGMGKGVIARSDIRENDTMLFVPKDIIICTDTVFKSSISPKVLRKLEKLRDQEDELLTAFLVLEQLKGSATRWSPYLQLLPQMPLHMKGGRVHADNPASPLFFTNDDQVEQLQDPHMIKIARGERSAVQRAFRRFKRLFGELVSPKAIDLQLTYERYVWARFLVNSRAFSIHGRRFLVPFGDFFNGQSQQQARAHDNGRHFLKFHELQDAGMVIRADRDTLQTRQVFEDYGDNDNYIYFLYHGFLMSDNPFDCAVVRLPPMLSVAPDGGNAGESVLETKMRVLRHFGVANGPSVCVSPDGSVREAPLTQFYSTLHRMSAEWMMAECDRVERYAQCFLSKDASKNTEGLAENALTSETAQFVVDAVHDQLAAYPTTMDQDEKLVQDYGLQERSVDSSGSEGAPNVHAVRFRASRKRILAAAIANLTRRIGEATDEGGDVHHVALNAHESKEPATDDAPNSAEASAVERDLVTAKEDAATKAPAPSPRHHDDRFERFQQWIQTLAFPINHLELRYVNDAVGYGAFATKQLMDGEVYLRVPVNAVMNVRSALQSSSRWLSQVSRALGNNQSADSWLTLHLLDEKFGPRSEQSRWRPYLDMLPSVDAGRMGSPLFYAEDGAEMQLLARTDLFPLVGNYRRRVLDMFLTLTNAIKTLDGVDRDQLGEWLTLDRFLWANAVLDSRSIWWGGQRHLVPLLDMINCRELAPNKAHKAHHTEVAGESGRFADTRASWTFATGDEVVENYGQPNYIYLLYHGFVLERNSHDCAHLHIDFGAALQGDKASDMALRRRVAAQLELMGVSAWRWDVCVEVDDAADVDRFVRMALYAIDPERALSGDGQQDATGSSAVRQEQAAAALKLVQMRLDRLGTSPSGHEGRPEGDEGCLHCDVVNEYVKQQRRQLRQLRYQFNAIM